MARCLIEAPTPEDREQAARAELAHIGARWSAALYSGDTIEAARLNDRRAYLLDVCFQHPASEGNPAE